jgi:hypothetical protein
MTLDIPLIKTAPWDNPAVIRVPPPAISLGRSCPDVCIELLTLADWWRRRPRPRQQNRSCPADLLDNTGYFRAEDQRISLGQSAVAGSDQGVPRAHTCARTRTRTSCFPGSGTSMLSMMTSGGPGSWTRAAWMTRAMILADLSCQLGKQENKSRLHRRQSGLWTD